MKNRFEDNIKLVELNLSNMKFILRKRKCSRVDGSIYTVLRLLSAIGVWGLDCLSQKMIDQADLTQDMVGKLLPNVFCTTITVLGIF